MAENKPAAKAAAIQYVVAAGVLVTREKGKNVEVGVGKPFTPADEEERDALLASGKIVPASEAASRVASAQAGASDAAIKAITARAEAAETLASDLQKQVDAQSAEIAALKAAAAGPANPANPAPAA